MNPPRARYGIPTLDAYMPPNVSIFFEMLYEYEYVAMPDQARYRIRNNQLEVCIADDIWNMYPRSINYFLGLVADLTPSDWEEIRNNSKGVPPLRRPLTDWQS